MSFSSRAEVIMSSLDLIRWEFKGDQFSCLLNQKVNKYGTLHIVAKPSAPLQIKLSSPRLLKTIVDAQIYALYSPWGDLVKKDITDADLPTTSGELSFKSGMEPILSAIRQGAWLGIRWKSGSEIIEHIIPTVRLENALNQFESCRLALPKVGYQQARDTVIYFKSGQRVVNNDQREDLLHLAEYIELDSKIKKVLVDGHTDSIGSRVANVQMSRIRADDVASLLMEFGVSRSLIETRAHGARYPVAKNNTTKGRNKNRRVTVRVIRQPIGASK